jgi:hypothetical protein
VEALCNKLFLLLLVAPATWGLPVQAARLLFPATTNLTNPIFFALITAHMWDAGE